MYQGTKTRQQIKAFNLNRGEIELLQIALNGLQGDCLRHRDMTSEDDLYIQVTKLKNKICGR